jgi:Na+-transporting NADH:ubiquinone oxidoreductase subunit NqrF
LQILAHTQDPGKLQIWWAGARNIFEMRKKKFNMHSVLFKQVHIDLHEKSLNWQGHWSFLHAVSVKHPLSSHPSPLECST